MKSIFSLLLLVLFSISAMSQSVNNYKYVLVPNSYSWTKQIDKYQINSLTTFLFKKYGFQAYQLGVGDLPDDMNKNSCNSLTADVEDSSGLIRTKLKVVLKDCDGKIVFISEEGSSKLKDYTRAHHGALRMAFLSIADLQYRYNGAGSENTPSSPATTENSVIAEVSEEKPEKITNPIESKSILGREKYNSQDGSYSLVKGDGVLVFYEGDTKIGVLVSEQAASYTITTTEFAGKGYFENDQFIIEREIKGVQGIIKMIFEKE